MMVSSMPILVCSSVRYYLLRSLQLMVVLMILCNGSSFTVQIKSSSKSQIGASFGQGRAGRPTGGQEYKNHRRKSVISVAVSKNVDHDVGPITADPSIPLSLNDGLLAAAAQASIPRDPETADGAHDAFRYEWGRWVDDDSMEALMKRVDEIRLATGVYDAFEDANEENDSLTEENKQSAPRRLRVAGGDHWDCILHVLPPGTEWKGRWPTGAWAVVKALTGIAEISMLRGPNRDGFFTKATKKDLRGGGDGSLTGGSSSVGGEDCVKYVGGAFRGYSGKSGKTTLLEVVVRPPSGKEKMDGDGFDSRAMESLHEFIDPNDVLLVAPPSSETEEKSDEDAEVNLSEDSDDKPETETPKHLGTKMGMTFDKVGGLDEQLNAIVRRVLASRANPEAARRLGVSHVRGILLSGPPGCGKTLLARELSNMLGAREPQIVNGPEILDKFVGEAEKNIRALFAPAELEYAQVGDASALHVIVLDEMDAIARKRGTITGDSTGVRDSVVNQLLSKMDGVKEANNVLVVGLTNRPELLDPALLRPGRLEVQLRVELPDLNGRRDILRIHTRRMNAAGGLSDDAKDALEDVVNDSGIPSRTEHFTGAELAGLIRSAASFALARTVEGDGDDADDEDEGVVTVADLERALGEVRPALGKQDDILEMRYPHGISPCSPAMRRIMRDLERFTSSPELQPAKTTTSAAAPRLQSLLIVGGSNSGGGGTGATALACWAAADASARGEADYVRLVTSLDLLSSGTGGDEEARAMALVDRFAEAGGMSKSLLVLDDVDQLCAGTGPGGYSSIMLATLRALLRSPPVAAMGSKDDENKQQQKRQVKSLRVLAATSRSDAACVILHELFDETLVVPLLSDSESVRKLLMDGTKHSGLSVVDVNPMADMITDRLGQVGCKAALRITERAVAMAGSSSRGSKRSTDVDEDESEESRKEIRSNQIKALEEILEDLVGDEAAASQLCEVF